MHKGEKKMSIKIKYNGSRFPRIVVVRGRKMDVSFQRDKKVLELVEYDALYLLSKNQRLNPNKWEFTVEGATAKNASKPVVAKKAIRKG